MGISDPANWTGGIPVVPDPNALPRYTFPMPTTASASSSLVDFQRTLRAQWEPQTSPPRRGQPRRHVIVWLEHEDELIPAPWTDCVTHRFFDHATATFGVIVESPDIPWITSPGIELMPYPSWEALDIAIRRHILNDAARTLPQPSPSLLGAQGAQATQAQRNYQSTTLGPLFQQSIR